MGLFSFKYADDMRKRIRLADNKEVYLLKPNGEPYKGSYDGYGHVGSVDVYEYLVDMNKQTLFEQLTLNSVKLNTQKIRPWLFRAAILYSGEGTEELVKESLTNFHKNDEPERFAYRLREWKRELGIELYFKSEESKNLEFPLKIASKPMAYEECNGYSADDPKQGCD